eukprot:71766_1
MAVFAVWLVLIYLVNYSFGGTIQKFEITTTSTNPISEPLIATLFWDGSGYQCDFITSGGAAAKYECSASLPWTTISLLPIISANIPYYIKLERESSIYEISSIAITTDVATYTINEFCIHDKMRCTFDQITGFSSTSLCTQFEPKNKYNLLAIGGNTKFKLLYIDLKNNVELGGSSNQEGNVRPPRLSYIGIKSGGSASTGKIISISAQWDNELYGCSFNGFAENFADTCAPQNMACPGASDFWISVHNPDQDGDGLKIQGVYVVNENFETYQIKGDLLCHASGIFGSPCKAELLLGGGSTNPNLLSFSLPDCLFNYSDIDISYATIDATNGWNLEDAQLTTFNFPLSEKMMMYSDYGWDSSIGQYGGPLQDVSMTCPPTPEPTTSPTSQPTQTPSLNPSKSPSKYPTNSPIIDTSNPSKAPSKTPTTAPIVVGVALECFNITGGVSAVDIAPGGSFLSWCTTTNELWTKNISDSAAIKVDTLNFDCNDLEIINSDTMFALSNEANNLYYKDNSEWQSTFGKANDISGTLDGSLWAVDHDERIWRKANNQWLWELYEGNLDSISAVNYAEAWGIFGNFAYQTREDILQTNPTDPWVQKGTQNLETINVNSKGEAYGLDSDGKFYKWNEIENEWIIVNDNHIFGTILCNINDCYGIEIGSSNQICHLVPGTSSGCGSNNVECANDEFCIFSDCVKCYTTKKGETKGCSNDEICGDGICEEETCGGTVCVPPSKCTANNQCVECEGRIDCVDAQIGDTCISNNCYTKCGNKICSSLEVCVNDICVSQQCAALSCPFGYICNREETKCIQCEGKVDCDSQESCISNVCYSYCESNTGKKVNCEQGTTCNLATDQCTGNRRMLLEIDDYCDDSIECLDELVCWTKKNTCEQCISNADCGDPASWVCVGETNDNNNYCHPRCLPEPHFYCKDELPVCKTIGECVACTDNDSGSCENGQVCVNNQCKDCTNENTGICTINQKCIDNKCIDKNICGDDYCKDNYEVCAEDTKECVECTKDEHCSGKVCDTYKRECGEECGNTVCIAPKHCFNNEYCAGCGDKNDCDDEEDCVKGMCQRKLLSYRPGQCRRGHAKVHGDPHFKTFDGAIHSYQGLYWDNYYYMVPCKGQDQYVPFRLIGHHIASNR